MDSGRTLPGDGLGDDEKEDDITSQQLPEVSARRVDRAAICKQYAGSGQRSFPSRCAGFKAGTNQCLTTKAIPELMSLSHFQIRLMTSTDAPSVAALSAQLGYPAAPTVIAERLELFSVSGEHGCYVADREGDVLGWVDIFSVHMLLSPRFFAEIGGLVVDSKARRQGVGSALMAQAEIWAKEHGFAEVRLRSGLHRTDAHKFYQSIGYELAKTSHLFRKVLASV